MAEDDPLCPRCGGGIVATRRTVPYIAPGPRVVALRHMPAFRCTGCDHLNVEVPNRRALDGLARRVVPAGSDITPEFVFEDGHWHIASGHTSRVSWGFDDLAPNHDAK